MDFNDLSKPNEISDFEKKYLSLLYNKSKLLCNPTLNLTEDEKFSNCKESFQELERFVLGSEKLLTKDFVLNSICGKAFKSKEQTYICRDCATDVTCRFCRACFVQSEHTKHNYQLFPSSGSGYCDCGDVEAWKSFPGCNIHGGGNETSSSSSSRRGCNSIEDCENDIDQIPVPIQIRFLTLTKNMFNNIKYFILRPLCKESDRLRRFELERELNIITSQCPDEEIDDYALVLYNNEIHNFEQVIDLFKKCLSCSAEQAMEYANIVDRDGRCVALSMNNLRDIEAKQQDILTRSKTQTKVELLCRIHHPLIIALQNYLLHNLRWLFEFTDQYPHLRLLLCRYLFSDVRIGESFTSEKSTFIQDIFTNHTETWKTARSIFSNFLISTTSKDQYFKRQFAVEFVTNYREIIDHYSTDDHNHQDSLMSLTCQLFPVTSLAHYLLDHHNVLANIIQVAYDELSAHTKPLVYDGTEYYDIPTFSKDEKESYRKFDPYDRQLKSFADVKYLLTSLLTCFSGSNGESNQWTEKSIVNFLEFFRLFAKILCLIHETNTIERVLDHHIERDPHWRTGIILMYDLVPCITLTSNLIMTNPTCWDQSFEICRYMINDRLIRFESKKRMLFSYLGFTAHVIDNDCPRKTVSVIKPLHRFMAAILQQSKYIKELTTIEVDCLFDQALQMVVFTSQQTGNMWIRNGSVPYILTQQMKCLSLSSEMYDRDMELIQQLALCMNPEEFLLKCIHKFDLQEYFAASSGILSDKKATIQRVEDFLHLLIVTLFFRHRLQVGKGITKEKCYEHLIFHILCVKPHSHSRLMKKLPLGVEKYVKEKLITLINNVSEQTELSQVVMFNAKKDLLAHNFDRFSLYYTIQDRNEAQLYVEHTLKKELGISAAIHPNLIEFSESFSGMYRYLSDPCLLRVLDKILTHCNENRNGEYWTDTILDMVLYLIGACLMEDFNTLDGQCQENRRTLFIETALKPDLDIHILESLEFLCSRIFVSKQLELIRWTIRKWNEVLKKVSHGRISVEENAIEMDVESSDLSVEESSASQSAAADIAKERRMKLMKRMMDRQLRFLSSHSDSAMKVSEPDNGSMQQSESDNLVCILCQESAPADSGRPIVALAGAWRSTVLAKHPFTSMNPTVTEADGPGIMSPVPESLFLDTSSTSLPRELFGDEDLCTSGVGDRVVMRPLLAMLDHPEETFITTCGHFMHYDCKTRYVSDMVKHRQNMARTKGVLYPRIFNRCPLCKCVSNIDIPIIRSLSTPMGANVNNISFIDWTKFFSDWAPPSTVFGCKRTDQSMSWWDKLGNQLSNIRRITIPFIRTDSHTSGDDLLSGLAFKVGLAIKLQPKKFTKEIYNKYENVSNSVSESSMQDLLELDHAVSYTISVWEQILSISGTSILTEMPERHYRGLNYLIKAVFQCHEQLSEKDHLNRDCQQFLKILQQILFHSTKSSIHQVWYEQYNERTPIFILEVDFYYIVTSLLFMRSSFRCPDQDSVGCVEDQRLSTFLHTSTYNMNIVRLIFQFVSVQALLSLHISNIVDTPELIFGRLLTDAPDLWTEDIVDQLYRFRMQLVDQLPSLQWPRLNKYETVACFTRAMMPYLRCCTLLLTSLGSLAPQSRVGNCEEEFNTLTRVLGLNIVPVSSNQLPDYIKTHLDIIKSNQDKELQTPWGTKLPHPLPHAPPHLIELPLDFAEVVALCFERGCGLRRQAAVTVTEMSMCLICGDTFCLNGYCCRRPEDSSVAVISGAQIHSRQCHGGYSLYLNTRNSKVVVMFYQARWQITLDPIYVDRYGESDIDLTKGNPLFLRVDSYRRLQRRWLDHSIGCVVNDGYVSNDFFV